MISLQHIAYTLSFILTVTFKTFNQWMIIYIPDTSRSHPDHIHMGSYIDEVDTDIDNVDVME